MNAKNLGISRNRRNPDSARSHNRGCGIALLLAFLLGISSPRSALAQFAWPSYPVNSKVEQYKIMVDNGSGIAVLATSDGTQFLGVNQNAVITSKGSVQIQTSGPSQIKVGPSTVTMGELVTADSNSNIVPFSPSQDGAQHCYLGSVISLGSGSGLTGTYVYINVSPSCFIYSTGSAAGAFLLNPTATQTVANTTFDSDFFDQAAITSYSAQAQGAFNGIIANYGGAPQIAVGSNRLPTTAVFFNDRPGADGVQNTMFLYSVITNNTANRGNSTQGSALNANSFYTGSFNFGFMNAANFNTENLGTGTLNQAIDLWAASPINTGGGSILNTVGLHIAAQNLTSGINQITARQLELENMASTGANARSYGIYSQGGNHLLNTGDTFLGALTLNCPTTEVSSGCTYTFSTLPTSINSVVIENGTIIYCTDCVQQDPCAGSGSGAFAMRINGAWSCSAASQQNTPIFNTPSTGISMVNTPSTVLVGPTSMITPSVNGTYRFTLAITETSAGIAGTCTTGNIGLSLSYKQADSGVTYALGTTVEGAWFTIFGSSITSTTTTIAGGAPGANNDARIIPIEFRAASGTPIQFQVFENTAGNCTTPPVVTIRPALYFAGF